MPRTIILIVISAVLLIISHPQLNFWLLAWFGLVPFLFAIEGKSKRAAFAWGLFFGFLYFLGTIGWLVYVTYPGAFLLSSYLALYPAFFAIGFIVFRKLPLLSRVVVLSFLWIVLEYLRAKLFTGFGWAALAHSQSCNLWMIQIADVTGLYGVSFLVILVNLVIFYSIKSQLKNNKENLGQIFKAQWMTSLLLLLVMAYGLWQLKTMQFQSTVKVAVIQPNIAQDIKWDERYMPLIVEKTLALTDQAAAHDPDFILWPETSLPGVLSEQPAYLQRIQLKAMDLKKPIMMGSILQDKSLYYNSALLIGGDGQIKGHYNKIHLVPFGEFLPLRPLLGWINHYIGLEDFTSGKVYMLFPIKEGRYQFGVLICFEDTLGYVARKMTQQGAQLLVNMTNDAWFMDTKEPFMHLSASVFEAIENRRSLVRSANTGVSGFIDPLGKVMALVQSDKGKKTFISGFALQEVPINNSVSFYTKFGDIFTYLGFVCILWGILKIRRINV